MSKWYEVKTVSYSTVLVEVADDEGADEAYSVADDSNQFDEAECVLIDGNDLAFYKRHADEVISL